MARKSKKTGSYSNCSVRGAKKSGASQLEWGWAAIDGASRWLWALYRIHCVYEVLQPWIEQHVRVLTG
jgi:hypothetical protein